MVLGNKHTFLLICPVIPIHIYTLIEMAARILLQLHTKHLPLLGCCIILFVGNTHIPGYFCQKLTLCCFVCTADTQITDLDKLLNGQIHLTGGQMFKIAPSLFSQ